MLKSVFLGSRNNFDLLLVDWLSRRTELTYCFWTSKLSWSYAGKGDRVNRIIGHFLQRAKRYGPLKSINEFFYFLYYRKFILQEDSGKLNALIKSYWSNPKESQPGYKSIFINDINSDGLLQIIKDNKIDIMFVVCTNAIIPQKLYSAPLFGTFLWHEGIVPEYRGLYGAFWALYNREYDKLGYTLLKMTDRLDTGPIYVQGRVRDVDPYRDFWVYIGHKAIYDSLPEVEVFLKELEISNIKEIDRNKAPSGYYTYPGFTQLVSLLLHRKIQRVKKDLGVINC